VIWSEPEININKVIYMKLVRKKIPKNTWLVKRAWFPLTFIQEVEQTSITSSTSSKIPKFEEITIFLGEKVHVMIHSSLKSPIPIFQYRTLSKYKEIWLFEARNVILTLKLETSEEAAEHKALHLYSKSALNVSSKDTVLRYYES
jgi:hypothetical protein